MYKVFATSFFPLEYFCLNDSAWVSLSATEKRNKQLWSRWGVVTGKGWALDTVDHKSLNWKPENYGHSPISYFTWELRHHEVELSRQPPSRVTDTRAVLKKQANTELTWMHSRWHHPSRWTHITVFISIVTLRGRSYYPCYTWENRNVKWPAKVKYWACFTFGLTSQTLTQKELLGFRTFYCFSTPRSLECRWQRKGQGGNLEK